MRSPDFQNCGSRLRHVSCENSLVAPTIFARARNWSLLTNDDRLQDIKIEENSSSIASSINNSIEMLSNPSNVSNRLELSENVSINSFEPFLSNSNSNRSSKEINNDPEGLEMVKSIISITPSSRKNSDSSSVHTRRSRNGSILKSPGSFERNSSKISAAAVHFKCNHPVLEPQQQFISRLSPNVRPKRAGPGNLTKHISYTNEQQFSKYLPLSKFSSSHESLRSRNLPFRPALLKNASQKSKSFTFSSPSMAPSRRISSKDNLIITGFGQNHQDNLTENKIRGMQMEVPSPVTISNFIFPALSIKPKNFRQLTKNVSNQTLGKLIFGGGKNGECSFAPKKGGLSKKKQKKVEDEISNLIPGLNL